MGKVEKSSVVVVAVFIILLALVIGWMATTSSTRVAKKY